MAPVVLVCLNEPTSKAKGFSLLNNSSVETLCHGAPWVSVRVVII